MDDLNLFADGPPLSGGFDEIKHLQVSGLTPLAVVSTPEPLSMAVLGVGLLGLGVARRRRA